MSDVQETRLPLRQLQLVLCARQTMDCLSCREFKLSDDMFAQDSIELLKQSGIDFAKMEARGIDVSNFGELLMSSGIVLNEDVSHCQNLSLLSALLLQM